MDNRLSKKYHLHQNTKKYNKLYDTLSLQVPINASALNTWTRPRSAQHCFAFYPPPTSNNLYSNNYVVSVYLLHILSLNTMLNTKV